MTTSSNWAPASSMERHSHIDILRGMALFGVLMVNIETIFRVPLLEHILKSGPSPSRAGHIVDLLVSAAL